MRTRSQPVSPGGFVSLETDRAPRRKRAATTTSTTSTGAKVEKSTSKQPAKKTTKRTRKTTKRKTATKKNDSTGSEEPMDEEETQTESVASAAVEQPATENTQSEHPFPFSSPPGTQEYSPRQTLLAPEALNQEAPFTPVRQSTTEETSISIPAPASASSIDTPSAGAALYAAAREAIDAPSPFLSEPQDTQDTFADISSPAVAAPTTEEFSELSRVLSVLQQHTPAATGTHGRDLSAPTLPSQDTSLSTEPAYGTSSSFDFQEAAQTPVQQPVEYWHPTVLSPIIEQPESSPAVSQSPESAVPRSTPRVQVSGSFVSSPTVDSPSSEHTALGTSTPDLQRRSLGQRGIFSAFTSPGAAALARPLSRLDHRADSFSSVSPETPTHIPRTAEATGSSGFPSTFSFSSSFPLSSPEDLLSSPVPQDTPGIFRTGIFRTSNTRTPPGLLRRSGTQETHHGDIHHCHCCGAVLQCPNGHLPGASQHRDTKGSRKKKLTTKVAPIRKRNRNDLSDNEDADIATPLNKRRNIGAPGSTPFAHRSTPLSRRRINRTTPFSEQRRRRALEGQGRIDKTLFRLPQLIAQTESDLDVTEEPDLGPCEQPRWDGALVGQTSGNKDNQADVINTQQPSTPETPRRGWGIRGLFSSVPRSFSNLFPTLGLSPERSEPSDTAVPAPASERIDRTLTTSPPSSFSYGMTGNARAVDQEPKEASPHDLSYSLFPAPIDKSRYLETRSDSRMDKRRKLSMDKGIQVDESGVSTTPEPARHVSHGESKDGGKKRKRPSTSPDVIPNPPGCSYGMDLNYFTYSPESEDETAAETHHKSALTKRPARGILRPQRPPPKRVRFDTSPENTPSKLRLRATDAYTGEQFVGVPDPFAPRETTAPGDTTPRRDTAPPAAPVTPTPAYVEEPRQRPPGFVPNPFGTYRLDYDAFSSDSESSGESTPLRAPPASELPAAREEIEEGSRSSTWTQPPPPRPIPAHAALPSTTSSAVDNHALAKVRSQAEKYKPKTPSGLRTASRYASPMGASPSGEVPSGDDDFARDAQWLIANCPSGDLSQLSWPRQGNLVESLGVDPAAGRLLAQLWEEGEVEEGYGAFSRSLEEFAETLA